MVHRNLTPEKIEKKKKADFVEEGEDCIDERLNHINENGNMIQKYSKND